MTDQFWLNDRLGTVVKLTDQFNKVTDQFDKLTDQFDRLKDLLDKLAEKLFDP